MKENVLDVNSDRHVKLTGDRKKAASYLPFAQSKLKLIGDLSAQHDNNNQQKTYQFENNSVNVNIKITNGERFINIDANPNANCGTAISGIGKIENISNDAKGNKLFNSFYPSVSQFNQEQAQSPITLIKGYRPEPRIPVKLNEDYFNNYGTGIASQHKYIKSSMYTGSMRQCIQQLLGKSAQITYDYHFERSHGLFYYVKSIDTTSGDPSKYVYTYQLYVIEIGKNGVFKKYIDHCIPTFKRQYTNPIGLSNGKFPFQIKNYGFPYGDQFIELLLDPVEAATMTTSEIKDQLQAGKIIQLLSADDMKIFYENNHPLYTEQGWCFTEMYSSGTKVATNISIDNSNVSTLFNVNFTSLFGEIISASLVSGASGQLAKSSVNSGLMVPNYTDLNNITFDTSGTPGYSTVWVYTIGSAEGGFKQSFPYVISPPPDPKYKFPGFKSASDIAFYGRSNLSGSWYSTQQFYDPSNPFLLLYTRYKVLYFDSVAVIPLYDRQSFMFLYLTYTFYTDWNPSGVMISSGIIGVKTATGQLFNSKDTTIGYEVSVDPSTIEDLLNNSFDNSSPYIATINTTSDKQTEKCYGKVFDGFLRIDMTDYPTEDYDNFSFIGDEP